MNNLLRWVVGDVEIVQIPEMEDNELFSTFIPQAKTDKIQATHWMAPDFADEKGTLKARVQSFLICSNGKNILIDTCNGNGKDRPNIPTWGNLNTDFLKRFEDNDISPETIDIVACTHLHFDHVGWNTYRKDGKWIPTFPHAKYLFSKKEYDYWVKKPAKEMIDDFNGIDDSVIPVVDAGLAKFVPQDFQIDPNISFISTPGHTPHHVSILIRSQGEEAIISGDVLHHPCQIAFPDWTTLADTYPEQTIETRKKFLHDIANTETLLIGSHFADPVAGKIIRIGGEYIFKI
ncbi:MAG: Zn-dependent hydrolase, glyoxylase [Candidatus Gottesmanbacteria bacterium GW2011_GWC2_39_8]|uniref:Zn-dependent hydrolase, glyoxylase n=1 Tax=Candidatus Gottesmanbacteria bacterium GW2011_GWC2_39_8 TaxID=1618450 RepID=A0A0G0T128_9BACT|nr:MAG: Zn-dependent hydrolase, glyoxylase [Candidatus Gottesmanbacteria bacterium GW2011_GWC2_39_8]